MIKINDDVYLSPHLIKEIKVEITIGGSASVIVYPREPTHVLYFGGHFEFTQGDREDMERARAAARARAFEIALQITEQMRRL